MGASTISEAIGEQIARVRHQRGWTQRQLADAVQACGSDLTRGAVAKIESGTRHVSLDEWLVFAAALNAPPLELLVPSDPREWVTVGDCEKQVRELRGWLRGEGPLYEMPADVEDARGHRQEAERDFHAAKPAHEYREWEASHHRAVRAAQDLAYNLLITQSDDDLEATGSSGVVSGNLRADLQSVTRHVETLLADLDDLEQRKQREARARRAEREGEG